MSNYPPGVHAGTPNAPWNDKAPETCDECGGVYAYDGHRRLEFDDTGIQLCHACDAHWEDEERDFCPECGDEDVAGLPCPNDGMTMADYEEARESAAAEAEYERQREKQMFNQHE